MLNKKAREQSLEPVCENLLRRSVSFAGEQFTFPQSTYLMRTRTSGRPGAIAPLGMTINIDSMYIKKVNFSIVIEANL